MFTPVPLKRCVEFCESTVKRVEFADCVGVGEDDGLRVVLRRDQHVPVASYSCTESGMLDAVPVGGAGSPANSFIEATTPFSVIAIGLSCASRIVIDVVALPRVVPEPSRAEFVETFTVFGPSGRRTCIVQCW